MMAAKPVLDTFIDVNILFLLAFSLWWLLQAVIRHSRLKQGYALQLKLLKAALALTILSPILAFLAVSVGHGLWPDQPITLRDIAVAAYLRGDISLSAAEFEALLNARNRAWVTLFEGQSPWIVAAAAALLAGALLHFVRTLRSLAAVRKSVRGSYLWRRTRKVDIRLSDTVAIPFATRGLVRRYVVLPSSLVTRPRELRIVLAHEFQHLRDGDVEWELTFEFLRPLMYWNPAFGAWKRAFDRLRELGCDQALLARRRIAPREYANCLLDFRLRRMRGTLPKVMHVAFIRTGTGIAKRAFEERILALENAPDCKRGMAFASVLAGVFAIGACLAAASIRQPGDWSQDRLMLSTIVNLERLEAINRGYSLGSRNARP